MKEEFLHFAWKYGLYIKESFRTPAGDLIEVLHPGEYNRDSGPDFFNARIRYNGIEWAGNVEIHLRASHFETHGHNRDHAYDNTILHVVGEDDKKVFTAGGTELMNVVIKTEEEVLDRYLNLVNNPLTIACQEELPRTDKFRIYNWINALTIERLEEKYVKVKEILSSTGNDWEETFYRVMARYFGFRVNSEPFEMLSKTVPLKLLRKHGDNLLQAEALLFGAAGMLEEGLFRDALSDGYYSDLVREFRMLSAKYGIKPVHGWLWKFSKLRPVNFPTIRIAQMASLVSSKEGLFARVIEAGQTDVLKSLFKTKASEYWDNHYVFGRKGNRMDKKTGEEAVNIFLINAVIPVLFAYGKFHGSDEICSRALNYLESLPPEENRIVREWRDAGIEPVSASDTQGLLMLRENYCARRRCLECRIGASLIMEGSALKREDELMLEP